jgi:tetratricopeptide (TPR) repeat protein
MQQQPPRRASGAQGAGSPAAANLATEERALEGMLSSLARGPLPQEAWDRMHAEARKTERLSELAFAYESVAQGKRLKTAPAAAAAEFLFQAGSYFAEIFGDEVGAVAYFERALALAPGHPGSFAKLEELLLESQQLRKAADLYATTAQQRPRGEQPALLRRAAELYAEAGGAEDRTTELLQQVLRLDPADEESRARLEGLFVRANRFRDVVRLNEQSLAADPEGDSPTKRHLLARVVELYADKLHEPERALPHVEQLLAVEPGHEGARAVAQKLLAVKGLTGRAAAALATATESVGNPEEVIQFLALELESARGAKRASLLARVGRLKQERLGDDAGAFEALEQALAIDADDEARTRYVGLALSLGRHAEAAKTLSRVLANVKDAAVRAKVSAQLGEVLLRGGDARRAKTVLVGVLGSADAPPEAMLAAAYVHRAILEAENDARGLVELLDRIASLEPDVEKRRVVDERLSELATETNDGARAIAAYERLLSTTGRARALTALIPLYEKSGDPLKQAMLLEERAKDVPDLAEARSLLMRAAAVRAKEPKEALAAMATCRVVIARFGAAHDVLAILLPLLEAQRMWSELAEGLASDAGLTPAPERAQVLARLGAVKLQRLHDTSGAIAVFAEALAAEPQEKTARIMLEKLAAGGEHRLAAARVLEPIFRRESARAPLIKMLEIRGALAEDVDQRLNALREAMDLAASGGQADASRAVDLLAKALTEAVAEGKPLHEWLDRLERLAGPGTDSKRRATILATAIGDRAVDRDELSTLAKRAAQALAATGDAPAALALYRRALAFEPHSADLLGNIDDLLRDQGSPHDRIALYRNALEGAGRARRRELLHRIGGIERNDIGDVPAAIATYRAALDDDADDLDASRALEELYRATARWVDLCALLEERLTRTSGGSARAVEAQLAELHAAHGDPYAAEAHCLHLLEDPDLGEAELDALDRAVALVDSADVARLVLRRRAGMAEEPKAQIAWLDRLAELENDVRGDLDSAARAWKAAAEIAEGNGDDEEARRLYGRARRVAPEDAEVTARLVELCERAELWSELPRLYVALANHSTDDDERVALALRTARVLADRLGDARGAVRHAATAFELAPARADVLEVFEKMSVAGRAVEIFDQAVDEVLRRSSAPARGEGDPRLTLLLARARVLGSDAVRADQAAQVYRGILQDDHFGPPEQASALAAFDALIAGDPEAPARRADRRWLLEWRAEHAPEEQRVARWLDRAREEEITFGDPARALTIYRRVLELDSECDEALTSIARLAFATGDAEQALVALRTRRARTEGPARTAIDREIARILLERTTRRDEALESLGEVLADAPGDAEALALVTQLLADRTMRPQAVRLLEKACEASDDGATRETILLRLLEAPSEDEDPADRQLRFEKLCDLQRDGGHPEAALGSCIRAARELPQVNGLWDRAESLARELSRPNDVTSLYEEVLARPLPSEAAVALGERALRFYEEWFDDATRIARLLERVLDLAPDAEWAFDRLKLLFDSGERWDDLFALYDRVLATTTDGRRATLLQDAAQTAKDFADRPGKATQYLEQLRELRPADTKLASSLERLYERQGKHRELVALLGERLNGADTPESRKTRERVAALSLDELAEPAQALEALEPLLERGAVEPTSTIWALLERILAAVPGRGETRLSTAPAGHRPSRPPEAVRKSTPPGQTVVRQRVAARLRDHYAGTGRHVDLARMLLIELEAVEPAPERARRHVQIADLYEGVGDFPRALEQAGLAVFLEPADEALRARVAGLAEGTGQIERLAEVLAGAADAAGPGALRSALTMQAASLRAERVGDAAGAMALLSSILGQGQASDEDALAAATRLEPLLEAAGRSSERLAVLDRIAGLERDPANRRSALGRAARLALVLGLNTRSAAFWEQRLAADERDAEALDGLVDLLAREGQNERLVEILALRARASASPEARRADRVRVAALLGGPLGRSSEGIDAWRAIIDEFGPAEDAAVATAALLRDAGRWPELADLLDASSGLADGAAARADRLAWLGEVARERLGTEERAVDAYRRALDADPACVRARAGLDAMAGEGAQRAGSVEALLGAFRRCDDWHAILELAPKRIAAASDDAARIAILLESSALAEQRTGDSLRAFQAVREAFALDPANAHAQSEVARLAEAAGTWQALVDAYRAAIDTLQARSSAADPAIAALSAALWSKIGAVLEERLGDAPGALDAYLKVVAARLDADAARAAVRVAGDLQRWDVASRVVVDVGRSDPELARECLDAYGRACEARSAWDAGAQALTEATLSAGLGGPSAREIHARTAAWHRDVRHDAGAAEASFQRALEEDPANVELLVALADLLRRHPSPRLVETLVALSDATGGSLPLLREAGDLARSALGDSPTARALAERVFGLARDRWGEGENPESHEYALGAIEALAALHEQADDAPATLEVLCRGEDLPFDAGVKRSLRRRAARIALDRVRDDERAIALYLAVLADEPGDAEAADRLAALYGRHGRQADLLRLRQGQIAVSADASERLRLRLEAAGLLVELGDAAQAVEVLREGLRESARDESLVAKLAGVLRAQRRFADLRLLLEEQAQLAEDAGDRTRAADLWSSAARLAEDEQGDAAAAATFHERTVALEPRGGSFEALARLAKARGDDRAAAAWLERWTEVVEPAKRAEATLRYAEALAAAGEADRATERLERALSDTPDAEPLRARLVAFYREREDWAKLAGALAQAAAHAPDKGARLGRLLEAAKLYLDRCAAPGDAVPLLEQATDLAPEDQAVRLALADALVRGGRHDEARTLLHAMVEAFGARRPKERAPVHYQMALLELATGNPAKALLELDTASRVDPQNPQILARLAQLARDDGQLERAEKSFRALLVILRRREDAQEASAIARSEVLLELSAIAARRGEADRAREILESTLETASQSSFEEDALLRALRTRGEHATLVRVLEARLARQPEAKETVHTLAELADVLALRLDRAADAFPVRMRALALGPASMETHAAALALAKTLGRVAEYVDAGVAMAEQAIASGDADLGRRLLARLGTVVEEELHDDRRAASLCERAIALGPPSTAMLRSLDRVYQRLGDVENEARVLAMRADHETREGGPRAAAGALFRLASLRLASAATLDEGAEMLRAALELEPQFDAAEGALRAALAIDPARTQLLDLFERVGREPGHERALVDALRLRAELPAAGIDAFRAAVDAAAANGDPALARSLLERFVDRERGPERPGEELTWAFAALAGLREAAGDLRGAVELKARAARTAEPEVARRLQLESARLALTLGDLDVAASTYAELHRLEPTDRDAWEPLAEVYRKRGAAAELAALLASVVPYVEDMAERARLRLERLRSMREHLGLSDADAAPLLHELLDEDPSQLAAALLLAEILERTGSHDELAALLARQIEAAKDRSDASSIASLSLRLGAILEPSGQALEARNVYYAALDWEPTNREILDSLLRLLGDEQDAGERADVLERRLAVERGPGAEAMAFVLFEARRESGDDAGAERALALGHHGYPASAALRDRLAEAYRQRGDWRGLAELLVGDAAHGDDTERKVAQLREAAGILGTHLDDARAASEALARARAIAPDDAGLLAEYVGTLMQAGDHAIATSELDAAITASADESRKASLLASRAGVRAAAGDARSALADLEAAFSVDPDAYADALSVQLARAREAATAAGDRAEVRSLRLRQAQVLPFAGDAEGARTLLGDLLRDDGKDRDALRILGSLESALERWEAASAAWRRLVGLEEGAAAAEAALALADACERAGRAGDARGVLERIVMASPNEMAVRERLRQLYEQTGAWHELADMALDEARASGDVAERFAGLLRAGTLLATNADDPQAAAGALEEALALRPGDPECASVLADAYLAQRRAQDALDVLDAILTAQKGRRTRELALIHVRMARAAHLAGDWGAEARALVQGLECDSQNGDVCAEVALRAMDIDQLDLATRALRAVTLLRAPGSMSKAVAYRHLGEIAGRQGDPKRAVAFLRRAVAEDPALEEARSLIETYERSV